MMKFVLSFFVLFPLAVPQSLPVPSQALSPKSFVPDEARPKQSSQRRELLFGETFNEFAVDPRRFPKVVNQCFSFRDFIQLILHHERWGFYQRDSKPFGTFPERLSPFFGQMLAEQAFRMWQGMLRAGSISKRTPFTLVEFGSGSGQLAYDCLRHILKKPDTVKEWDEFAAVFKYVGVEIPERLLGVQREKNEEFGKKFKAVQADARSFNFAGPITGLIFSNLLIDTFGKHKIIVHPDGEMEVCFVLPSILKKWETRLDDNTPTPFLMNCLYNADVNLRRQLGGSFEKDRFYLSRKSFVELMDFFLELSENERKEATEELRFNEIYLPLNCLPESEAVCIQKVIYNRILPFYSPFKGSFIYYYYPDFESQFYMYGISRHLKMGYVLTLDVGSSHPQRLRALQSGEPTALLLSNDDGEDVHTNPYEMPTYRDIGISVNFSELAAAGEAAGLETIHFGLQRDLSSEIPISLENEPPKKFKRYEDFVQKTPELKNAISKQAKSWSQAHPIQKGEKKMAELAEQLMLLLPDEILIDLDQEQKILFRENLIEFVDFNWNSTLRQMAEGMLKTPDAAGLNFVISQAGDRFADHLAKNICEFLQAWLDTSIRNNVDFFFSQSGYPFNFGNFQLLVQRKRGTDPGFVFSTSPQGELALSQSL